jgi:hypothetical protein
MLASIVSNWLVWLLLTATLWGHASLCLAGSALAASRDKVMIDPQDFDLPLEEMSLQAKEQPSAPRPSWRELTVYLRERITRHDIEFVHGTYR